MPLQISKELLAQAGTDVKLGRFDRAASVIDTATAIFAKASVEKAKAPSDFFQQTSESLNSIANATTTNGLLVGAVHQASLMLAEYRSALEPAPAPSDAAKTVEHSVDSQSLRQLEKGRTTFVFNLRPDQEMIGVNAIPGEQRNFTNTDVRIENVIIEAPNGSRQTLDGIHWQTVVFVGAHIVYLGGDLDLQYVRFVNCTFDVPAPLSPRGRQLIDYTVLAQTKLKLPPSKG
jgi:hypothetical protein